MWPTPDAQLMNDSQTPEARDAHKGRELEKGRNGNWFGDPLGFVARQWKTPHGFQAGNGPDGKEFSKQVRGIASAWSSPTTSAGGADLARRDNQKPNSTLQTEATLWATPEATVMKRGDRTEHLKRNVQAGNDLQTQSLNWATPNARDHKGVDLASRNGGASLSHQVQTGEMTHSSRSSRQVQSIHDGRELSPTDRTLPPRLNPAFAGWLMGWPTWWTSPVPISFAQQEMELWRRRQLAHLSCLLGEQGSFRSEEKKK